MTDIKLVVMGAGGAGKSALTCQFVQGIFVEVYDPTIEDSYRKPVLFEDRSYVLEILDTAGTEQFTAMRDLYMKTGHGFIFVYSVTSESSFLAVADVYEQLLRVKDCDSVPCVLVGNKADLHDQRVITEQQGQKKADKLGCPTFIETSAKTRVNVDAAFMDVVRQVIAERQRDNAGKDKRSKHDKSKCSIL